MDAWPHRSCADRAARQSGDRRRRSCRGMPARLVRGDRRPGPAAGLARLRYPDCLYRDSSPDRRTSQPRWRFWHRIHSNTDKQSRIAGNFSVVFLSKIYDREPAFLIRQSGPLLIRMGSQSPSRRRPQCGTQQPDSAGAFRRRAHLRAAYVFGVIAGQRLFGERATRKCGAAPWPRAS